MTRDQFLTEYLGECWHERGESTFREPDADYWCVKCQTHLKDCCGPINNNFSTWPAFGKLWEAAQKDEQWSEFWNDVYDQAGNEYQAKTTCLAWPEGKEMHASYFWQRYFTGDFGDSIVSPDRFATAWAKFKGWKEEK